MRSKRLTIALLIASTPLLPACRREAPSPRIAMMPSHAETGGDGGSSVTPSASPSLDHDVSIAGLSFRVPDRYRPQAPDSPMRKAQFEVPGASGAKAGSLTVYYFGNNQGGSVQDNAERWQSQFTVSGGGPSVGQMEKTVVNGIAASIVTTTGTYATGMPMAPQAAESDFALWGAILEGPQGNVFIKVTGPIPTVHAATADLTRMLQTVRRVDQTL